MSDNNTAFFETVTVQRYRAGEWQVVEDNVLIERPVSLIYNGIPHVVIMCTSQDLVDFTYGFSLTEGIVMCQDDIRSIDIHPRSQGIEVRVEITPICFSRIEGRKRQMSARTGCGICGLDTLTDVVREQKPIDFDFKINESAIDKALDHATEAQIMNQKTGGAHAAFFVGNDGSLLLMREDVGRHVALDKLIGTMMQKHIDPTSGFILTTSRASFEMVQKAVAARVGLLVTMSAPTTMAIELAQRMKLKLAAFTRVGKINLYQG